METHSGLAQGHDAGLSAAIQPPPARRAAGLRAAGRPPRCTGCQVCGASLEGAKSRFYKVSKGVPGRWNSQRLETCRPPQAHAPSRTARPADPAHHSACPLPSCERVLAQRYGMLHVPGSALNKFAAVQKGGA